VSDRPGVLASHNFYGPLENEITGLEDCSREIEVRFWWKKSLRQVLSVFLAGELQEL
jgi:hypothetical protein